MLPAGARVGRVGPSPTDHDASGSVGPPRDGDPAACRALFDATARTLCRHRVPCDHAGAARRIREAGLPERFAARLETGARAGDLRPESARRSW
ncbi:MAG: hypothetical protein O9972_45570 [Burkholderiales bacterium]|nr:hypothetical protein [Burkholderiales bacterium]